MMKVSFLSFLLILIAISCTLFKEKKETVLQDEGGYLELIASVKSDSLSVNQIEDLRIYMTLVNRYPFFIMV